MRKIVALFSVLLLGIGLVSAQTRTITGKVMDNNGVPVEGASILIKGTTQGTAAGADGIFSLSGVKSGDVLVISAINFGSTEVTIRNQTDIQVTLTRTAGEIDEVVVTALGIRRQRSSLSYATQQVSGAELTEARNPNAGAALSGKVSGVEIRQGNGIGGSTNIVIRGAKSLMSSNQALFVVDGVPLDNSNTNTSNQRTGRGGFDYGNAAADINPDDIESMNVLKGAAATALYGSRAANGVIMITTKKGRKGLGVTINSGVFFGSIDKSTFAKYQNQYGAGYDTEGYGAPSPNGGFWYFDVNGDGVKDLVVPTTEDASYGQKFDPNLMVYHWDAFDRSSPYFKTPRPWVAAANTPVAFYENSVSTNNNIMFDGGNDKGMFKLGYTRSDEKGILPNSSVLKNIVDFSASYNLTDRLTASASISYSRIDGKGRYGTGYNDWNVNQNFRQWYETNMDVLEQKAAYFRTGQNITWNWADPSTPEGLVPIYTDNPYWTRYENYQTDSRNRYFGYGSLNYRATDWLSFLARASMDTYSAIQEERIAVGSVGVPSYSRYNRNFTEYNYDLMANIDKDLTDDINLKGVLGTNLRRTTISSIYAATNGGLVVPKLYSLANSLNAPNAPTEDYQPQEVDGYYAGATFGFREFITLEGTFRRDISSTLPVTSNKYNYWSVSGSWLFSKNVQAPWLSYGKLRANYAEVGNGAQWGSISDIYANVPPFGSAILFSLPAQKNNTNLKPERTYSKEVGLELAFLQNRLGLDVSYYITNTRDQLIPVDISQATGYSSKFMNAGDVENKGIEISLNATPVKTKDFTWDIRVNWTKNKNKVVALYQDSKNLPLGTFQGGVSLNAQLGQPYGNIFGRTWVIDSATGQRVVGSNGRYVQSSTTTNVIGNFNPDWIGGVWNSFRYKGVSLTFLIDVRHGGDVFSLDTYYGMATGIYPETAELNDLGNPSRDPVQLDANGNALPTSGGIIVPGVTADGKPNTKRVANVYGTYGYSYNPQAAFIYDASYVKLREISLGYSLPASLFANANLIKGIDISVIGRNLWIIHKNMKYSDPEENLSAGNIQGYQSGAYPTTRNIGVNLRVKF